MFNTIVLIDNCFNYICFRGYGVAWPIIGDSKCLYGFGLKPNAGEIPRPGFKSQYPHIIFFVVSYFFEYYFFKIIIYLYMYINIIIL